MTRDELIADARHVADAESDGRWPNGTIINAADLVLRREWRHILNANRAYRIQRRTLTPTSEGLIAISDLSSGSGDSAKVFYRVLALSRGNVVYKEIDQVDVAITASGNGEQWGYQTWCRAGDDLLVLPINTDSVVVLVNHFPPLPSALASGSSTVVFPVGYEQILTYEIAAMLLSKGGTETEASARLKEWAEEWRRDLLEDVKRTSTNALQIAYPDSSGEWGA